MATNHARIEPQPKAISEEELGNLSPSHGRSNLGGSSSPDIVEFANRMVRHGEAYAAWKAQLTSPAPEAEAQSLAALQQDQARRGQQREENQSLNVLRQDGQQIDQSREEQLSLNALNQTHAANDNHPSVQADRVHGDVNTQTAPLNRDPSSNLGASWGVEATTRDGREALFRPNTPQLNVQGHLQEQGVEEQRSTEHLNLGHDLSSSQQVRQGSEEITRDGREALFRPNAPKQDVQDRERQLEIDR